MSFHTHQGFLGGFLGRIVQRSIMPSAQVTGSATKVVPRFVPADSNSTQFKSSQFSPAADTASVVDMHSTQRSSTKQKSANKKSVNKTSQEQNNQHQQAAQLQKPDSISDDNSTDRRLIEADRFITEQTEYAPESVGSEASRSETTRSESSEKEEGLSVIQSPVRDALSAVIDTSLHPGKSIEQDPLNNHIENEAENLTGIKHLSASDHGEFPHQARKKTPEKLKPQKLINEVSGNEKNNTGIKISSPSERLLSLDKTHRSGSNQRFDPGSINPENLNSGKMNPGDVKNFHATPATLPGSVTPVPVSTQLTQSTALGVETQTATKPLSNRSINQATTESIEQKSEPPSMAVDTQISAESQSTGRADRSLKDQTEINSAIKKTSLVNDENSALTNDHFTDLANAKQNNPPFKNPANDRTRDKTRENQPQRQTAHADSTPVINVSIGKVVLKAPDKPSDPQAMLQQRQSRPALRSRRPGLSLGDYLKE